MASEIEDSNLGCNERIALVDRTVHGVVILPVAMV